MWTMGSARGSTDLEFEGIFFSMSDFKKKALREHRLIKWSAPKSFKRA